VNTHTHTHCKSWIHTPGAVGSHFAAMPRDSHAQKAYAAMLES